MKKLMLLAGLWCLQPGLYASPRDANAKHDALPVNARDRAQTHFKENYAWVQDAAWYTTAENNLYCTFRQGKILNRVFYDKNGNWQYTLLSYPPSVLAKSVKDLISDNFHGYKISYVSEIRTNDQDPAYVVNIEDENHIKVIQVNGDNFEIRQDLNKQ
jgi:hypothetical protein